MRLSQFRELMAGEFGAARAGALARDHVLATLDSRTVDQALEDGVDAREIWLAVCATFDVPPERR